MTLLRLSLAAVAVGVLLALSAPGFAGEPVDPVGGLSRQIDRLVALLKDGHAVERQTARTVSPARLRDGTPLALVILTLEKYRGANNRGAFLAVFAGEGHAGEKAWTQYYRLLGVAKLGEEDVRIVTNPTLVGEDGGSLVIRLDVLDYQPGDAAGAPSRQTSTDYRVKRDLLYWSGEGFSEIR